MTIEEILNALSELIAGTTDEAAKTTLMTSVSDGIKPFGYVPETGVQAMIDLQVTGLKSKNSELLGTEKKLKDQMAAMGIINDDYGHLKNVLSDFGITLDNEGKLDNTKLEEFLESKSVDGGEAAKNAVALERNVRRMEREKKELERNTKGFADQIELRDKQLAENKLFIDSILIDQEMIKALHKNGFEDDQIEMFLPALKIQSKAVVEFDDTTGARTAITDDGKAVGEWVDWFANTDKGKALKPAPKNHGGSSPGNNGNRSGVTKPFAEMTPAEKGALFNEDPVKYRQLRDARVR